MLVSNRCVRTRGFMGMRPLAFARSERCLPVGYPRRITSETLKLFFRMRRDGRAAAGRDAAPGAGPNRGRAGQIRSCGTNQAESVICRPGHGLLAPGNR